MTYVNRSLPGLAHTQSVLGCGASFYENLQYRHDEQDRTFWCFLNPVGRPSFTLGLLGDLHAVQEQIIPGAGPPPGGRGLAFCGLLQN